MTLHDVVVIGAGFSGLAAAEELTAQGLEVVLLEALPSVGGRTRTVQAAGTWLEVGGQWASPEHTELLRRAQELGVGTFGTPVSGSSLLVLNGQVRDLDTSPQAQRLVEAVAEIDQLAARVALDAPWRSPQAAEQDALALDAWASRAMPDPTMRRLIVRVLEELMTTPAREMSLLSVLQGARSSGTLAAALGIEGGAQELRFDGGLHGIAVRMAERLGEVVRCSWPATSVVQHDGGVGVRSPHGLVEARRAVVALAPSQAAALDFDPALPDSRVRLHQQMAMGSVIKVNAVYDRPFWREQGRSGLVMDFDGPVTYCVDNSPPDRGAGEGPGVLVSFFAAEQARRFSALGAEARRECFLTQAERWFGADARQAQYLDQDWTTEPFVGGGYSGVMQPGGWTQSGAALREPFGLVHWGSSESSVEWTGYVEGALRAGLRAAREVLGELT